MATEAQSTESAIARGRDAMSRGAWAEARSAFGNALAVGETPEALEGLSWAAWWTGDGDLLFDVRERAYRGYHARGDRRGAARMAMWLGTDSVDFRGELAVAGGWLARARRLLEGDEACAEHGWLCVHEAEQLIGAEDTRAAQELGRRAAELGRRLGATALEMMGLAVEGLALVTEGEVERGLRGLDEAAAAGLAGEFEELPYVSFACCFVIYACERVRDYDRAAQWCQRATEYARRAGIEGLNRLCRAHHAGVLIWRGVWDEAEAELVAARDALGASRPALASEAVVRLAELRRRQGRLDEAGKLLEEIDGHPPALLTQAELCLDREDLSLARDLVERALRQTPERSLTQRAAALELAIRVHAGAGEPEAAAAALAELRTVADAVPGEPLRACASFAAGVVDAAAGDLEAARRSFDDAAYRYQRTGAPFESGRARIALAEMLARLGRPAHAAAEAEAAARVLERIGARRELERARRLAARAPVRGPLTRRESEVLRLVSAGRSDREIARDLVLSEHTVHRHMANVLCKLRCPSRSAAVADALRRGLI